MCILRGGVVNGGVNGLESRCQHTHTARRKAAGSAVDLGPVDDKLPARGEGRGREGGRLILAMRYVRSIFFFSSFFLFFFFHFDSNVFSRVEGLAVARRRGCFKSVQGFNGVKPL